MTLVRKYYKLRGKLEKLLGKREFELFLKRIRKNYDWKKTSDEFDRFHIKHFKQELNKRGY